MNKMPREIITESPIADVQGRNFDLLLGRRTYHIQSNLRRRHDPDERKLPTRAAAELVGSFKSAEMP